jgi:alpha-methylacyl-CoA racemase
MGGASDRQPEKRDAAASVLGTFLSGIRVIDLSQYIPGPMATLFLSDMGAEVLKVEPPHGDGMQELGPHDQDGQPVFYNALNAGKSVCRLNLKDLGDRATFLDLLDDADVVIEGFRTGVLERLGIDYPVLRKEKPSIILCSVSGYGVGTSRSADAGHDVNYLALSGVLHRNGSDHPMYLDPPMSDVAGALFAAMTILGALNRQARTGEGCHIDMALADTLMPMQLMQVADFGANGTIPQRGSTYLNGAAAYYQVYATSDGQHVALGAVEPKFWAAFCEASVRPDWIPRLAEPMPQTSLKAELTSFFGGLAAADVVARYEGVDCCLSIVNDLGAALDENHVAERRLVRRGDNGDLQSLFPAWVDGSPSCVRRVGTQGSAPAWPPRADANSFEV